MVDRHQVMGFRVQAQQLDRDHGTLASTAVLDLGVQDTGPDGAMWALATRGVDVAKLSDKELVLLWTLRGAPHVYRRADVGKIAVAVEPLQLDTSPPVLQRIAEFKKAAGATDRFSVVRAYLRRLRRLSPL